MSEVRNTELAGGGAVTDDHRELKENGQQKGYVVLTKEERAKGFARPVRRSYRHVGSRPKNATRELTPDEVERYSKFGYVLFETYPESESPVLGRFWTRDSLGGGCGSVTTMAPDIAETYARDPKFYGATFCVGCGKHLPLEQFVWEGTAEQVGS